MHSINDWSPRWFGIWREYGPSFSDFPSIKDFVFPKVVETYALEDLFYYLSNCREVATTSRSAFPEPFSGEILNGSISYRTDGTWLWLDDLPSYIEQYGVAIPREFLANIQRNDYQPVAWEGDIQLLDWPQME